MTAADSLVEELREQLRQRDELIEKLLAENKRLRKRVDELERKLGRDSSNSHQPPSQDPPSKRTKRRRRKPSPRKQGAQPGSKGHHRGRLDPDEIVERKPRACRQCGTLLFGEDPDPHVHQFVDIPQVLPHVVDYHLHRLECPDCGEQTKAELPEDVAGLTYGPRIHAHSATLTSDLRLSRRQTQKAMYRLFGLQISLGTISNIEDRVSQPLQAPYAEAVEAVRDQDMLWADETTWWRQGGQYGWLWMARSADVVAFHVDPHRSAQALDELLGEDYDGILTSDRFGVYRRRPTEARQICWAHLLRDFRALRQRDGPVGRLGQRLYGIAWLVLSWHRWHKTGGGPIEVGRDELEQMGQKLREAMKTYLRMGAELDEAPGIFGGLLESEAALWTWVDEPHLEPTNNLSERTLRSAVIWRKLSFGSESERGERFTERVLTVVETLKQQGRAVVEMLTDYVRAHLMGRPAPRLLPV